MKTNATEQNKLVYQSVTTGLWGRFISKVIVAVVFSYWGLQFFIASSPSSIGREIIIIIFVLVILAGVIYFNNPLGWNNRVIIDFDRSLLILQDNRGNEAIDILDFDGETISFGSIDHFSTQHYESVVLSAYYLVRLSVRGEEVKLLSFKDASVFTEFCGVLRDRLKLIVRNRSI